MIAARFWSKVRKGNPLECWPWTASLTSKGYGQFELKGKDGRANRAHRIVWELERGPIPKGKQVLHRCDNRLCVNPGHLFLGDNAANAADMVRKNRHGASKLTQEQVLEILRSDAPSRSQAKRFGISIQQINRIRNGASRWENTGLPKTRKS